MRWRELFRDPGTRRSTAVVAFATGLSLGTLALVWLAWTANNDMSRSTTLLLERRAGEVLALTSAALDRDMKGAWLSFLTPLDSFDIREDPPYDLLQLASRAFAHFPYPESFIVWADDGSDAGRTFAFNRTDRPIPWDPIDHHQDPYPVTLLRNPSELAPIVERIRRLSDRTRRFALIETTIANTPYHIVVHRFAGNPQALAADDESAASSAMSGFAAFTVNLDWVKREYFGPLLRQVATIDGSAEAMTITVLDERNEVIATSGTRAAATPIRQRTFPLLFVERSLVVAPPPAKSHVPYWTAQVQPSVDITAAASQLRAQTLLIVSFASAASLIAVLLTVRAVRASDALATLKSEFVAAVTHELKTPLALIKLVSDTLERGRYTSSETIHDYAVILSQEERRLRHLIENLLTYSRLSDVREAFFMEPVDLAELLEDALQPFQPRLKELGFAVCVHVDPELPRVRADRASLVQVFANIIDNAIKYSTGEARSLTITTLRQPAGASIAFSDRGEGIAPQELPRVSEKFYRGRTARESGSGLGLAIVQRIVQLHGGRVDISSTVGQGTTVNVTLPVAKAS